MKTLGLFDAKNRLSEVCDRIATTGEPVVVTRRGKPLVQIVPIVEQSDMTSVWGTVAESHAKYGRLKDDFDLPKRSRRANRKSPLA